MLFASHYLEKLQKTLSAYTGADESYMGEASVYKRSFVRG
jgi:hypothetical protein